MTHDHDPIATVLGAEGATTLEERAFCVLTESSLRLAYTRAAAPEVVPAPGRPPGALGVLDVRLASLEGPPLVVRVVVGDELARGAWREASVVIGDALRAALAERNRTKGNAT